MTRGIPILGPPLAVFILFYDEKGSEINRLFLGTRIRILASGKLCSPSQETGLHRLDMFVFRLGFSTLECVKILCLQCSVMFFFQTSLPCGPAPPPCHTFGDSAEIGLKFRVFFPLHHTASTDWEGEALPIFNEKHSGALMDSSQRLRPTHGCPLSPPTHGWLDGIQSCKPILPIDVFCGFSIFQHVRMFQPQTNPRNINK